MEETNLFSRAALTGREAMNLPIPTFSACDFSGDAIAMNNKAVECLGMGDCDAFLTSTDLFRKSLERVLSLLVQCPVSLANPAPSIQSMNGIIKTHSSPVVGPSGQHLTINHLGGPDPDSMVLRSIEKNDKGSFFLFAKGIVVSSVQPENLFDETDLTQLGSVVLFNTAILHHRHLISPSCRDKTKARHQVMCLYRQAYELASRCHLQSCHSPLDNGLSSFIALAVLNNLGVLYYELADCKRTNECMKALLALVVFHSTQGHDSCQSEMDRAIEQFVLNATILRNALTNASAA